MQETCHFPTRQQFGGAKQLRCERATTSSQVSKLDRPTCGCGSYAFRREAWIPIHTSLLITTLAIRRISSDCPGESHSDEFLQASLTFLLRSWNGEDHLANIPGIAQPMEIAQLETQNNHDMDVLRALSMRSPYSHCQA